MTSLRKLKRPIRGQWILLCFIWISGCVSSPPSDIVIHANFDGPKQKSNMLITHGGQSAVIHPAKPTESRECFERRTKLIESAGRQHVLFTKALQDHHISQTALFSVSGCANRDTLGSDVDNQWSVLFYHEGIHLLGNTNGIVKSKGRKDYFQTIEKKGYAYFINYGSPKIARLTYFNNTPIRCDLHSSLKTFGFLRLVDFYFVPLSGDKCWEDFYGVLEEWNAYLGQLGLAIDLWKNDSSIYWILDYQISCVAEFQFYVWFYLDSLGQKDAALFNKILKSPSIHEFAKTLLAQTNTDMLNVQGCRECIVDKGLAKVFQESGDKLRALFP